MPWKPSDALRRTHLAATPVLRSRWSAIANSALKQGLPDSSAIRIANSSIHKLSKWKPALKSK